jgi:hypothetical protein
MCSGGELIEVVNPPTIRSSWQLFVFLFTGMRFGLMQVKTGLCHILSRFEVAPCKDTPVPIVFNTKYYFLQINGEIRLSFNRKQFWNNIYIYIYIYTLAILDIETNIYSNDTNGSPLGVASVFSANRKLQCTLQFQFFLVTWSYLMTS